MNELVSIVMSTYKETPNHVKEAIDSILNQTWKETEFIIINDNPEDELIDSLILEYKDTRIVYQRNEKNMGLAFSLNRGIRLAKGNYIARMDADDISLSNRIEEQVRFLQGNTDVSIVGCWIISIDNNGIRSKNVSKCPTDHREIKAATFLGAPMFHPTVMFRKNVFEQHNLFYNEKYKYTQDYELWARAVHKVKFHNFENPLLLWRDGDDRISRKNNTTQFEYASQVHKEQLERIGVPTTDRNTIIHDELYLTKLGPLREVISKLAWIFMILNNNNKLKVFPTKELAKVLLYHYKIAVKKSKWKFIGIPAWSVCRLALFFCHK